MAITHGAYLVPVLSIGENGRNSLEALVSLSTDLYEQVHNEASSKLYSFQQHVKDILGFTLPLFHARFVVNAY